MDNEKSVFNEAAFQITCNNALQNGNMKGYRWGLECIGLELVADALRVKGTDIEDLDDLDKQNPIINKMSELDKNIEANKNNPEKYFLALKKKHTFLKALQELGGKGGSYIDADEDDME